jgi:hypothetical protein
MKRILLLAALLAGGCNLFSSLSSCCPSNAVGVSFDLFEEGANTDEIDVMVAIENQPAKVMTFTRSPGGEKETLEIDIDYKDNLYKHINVVAVARLKGKKVGSASDNAQIDNNCTNISLFISTGGSGCIRNDDCTSSITGSSQTCVNGACTY